MRFAIVFFVLIVMVVSSFFEIVKAEKLIDKVPVVIELSSIASLVVFLYLMQTLFISYYVNMLSEIKKIWILIYDFCFVPTYIVFFHFIVLGVFVDVVGKEWVLPEWFVVTFSIPFLRKFAGENLLPKLNPGGQKMWTKRFPPEKLSDMYRSFGLLVMMLLMPLLVSLPYKMVH